MSELWKIVLSLSVSGTAVILVLSLLCWIFRKKMSRRWQYEIWLVAVVRLLIPISVSVNLVGSVFSGVEPYAGRTDIPPVHMMSDVDEMDDQWERSSAKSNENGMGMISGQKQKFSFQLNETLNMIWLLTVFILLVQKIIAYRCFVKSVLSSSTPADVELLEVFGRIVEEKHIHKNVELYISRQVSSPLLFGFRKPSIILPEREWSKQDFHYTVLHELTHYCRWDLFYKWLVQFTICVHWFNPFVWYMGRQVNRTCELACDEGVLNGRTIEERRAYGDVLLRAAGAGEFFQNRAGTLMMHESKKLLKERLTAIAEDRRRPLWYQILSFLMVVILTAGAVSLGVYAGPKEAVFESGGNDFLLSDGTTVIERDRVFYILRDGMTEEALGREITGGSVDGTHITIVHKDYFASITLSKDRKELKEEAEKICTDMQKKGILSEADAEYMIETAVYIQERIMPVETEDEQLFDYHFTQSVYYQDGYLFYMGYNLNEESVDHCSGKELSLDDGEKLRVSFAASDEIWMEDETFLMVLQSLFSEFRQHTGRRVSQIQYPIIRNVEYVGTDVEALTETYFAEKELGRFAAMFQYLDQELQEAYAERVFQEEDAALFSIVIGCMYRNGYLDSEMLDTYVNKTLEAENLAFFSMLIGYMEQEAQQRWYDKLLEEQGRNYSAIVILKGYLEDGEDF